jgi:hypothetical protein
MTTRRLVLVIAVLAIVAAVVWLLSMAYPTLWCSIVGTCNA